MMTFIPETHRALEVDIYIFIAEKAILNLTDGCRTRISI